MLLDAHLLIDAHDASSPFCARALAWVEEQLNGARRVAIPWPSVVAFLRLTQSEGGVTARSALTKRGATGNAGSNRQWRGRPCRASVTGSRSAPW